MLSTITDKAVTAFADKKGNQAFDPTMIFVIAELVVQVIETLNEYCAENDPDAATEMVNKPTRLAKLVLRRNVKRSLGCADYRDHGQDVLESLYETGKSVGVEEMKAAYEELSL